MTNWSGAQAVNVKQSDSVERIVTDVASIVVIRGLVLVAFIDNSDTFQIVVVPFLLVTT